MNNINLIDDFLYNFENAWDKDPKTVDAYGINLNEFKQYVFNGNNPTIEQITALYPDDILIMWLQKTKVDNNLSVSSLNQRISALRSFYDWLRKRRLISINTAKDIPLFKNTKKDKKRIPTFEECQLLLNTANTLEKTYDNLRLKLAINLFLAAGLRIEECCNLRISDFIKEERKLNIIHEVKFNKEREVYLPQQVFNILDEYLELRLKKNEKIENEKHDILFLSRNNNIISTDMMRKSIYRLYNMCNIDDIDIHALRHAHSSLMASNNCPMHKLSNSIGHANLNTTAKIYVHDDNEDISKYNPLYNNNEIKKENNKPKVTKEENSNVIQISFGDAI